MSSVHQILWPLSQATKYLDEKYILNKHEYLRRIRSYQDKDCILNKHEWLRRIRSYSYKDCILNKDHECLTRIRSHGRASETICL